MIVNILFMYNSKHPHRWDESLPYVQHNSYRTLHSLIDHNPFEVGTKFQPLGPIDVALPIVSTQEKSSHTHSKVEKDTKSIERIQYIYQ